MTATDELKPCPFCGGEAEIITYRMADNDEFCINEIYCDSCRMSMMQPEVSEAEAAAAWNTRHEETCRVTKEHVDIDGERMTDYSCGCLNQSGWGHNYCPNCGRKVEQ